MSKHGALVAALLLAGAASGQNLTLGGQTGAVDYYMGTLGYLRFDAPVGAPAIWGFNTDPGPTVVGPYSIPLGLGDGLLEILGGAPTPPAGFFELYFELPPIPALEGLTIYSVGAWIDSGAPLGIGLTNGLAITFRAFHGDAGPDATTLVGKTVTLDGSGNTVLPSGSIYQWAVSSSPSGATATLAGADGAFPTFSADTPGSYVVTLTFGGPDGGDVTADAVVVEVFDIAFSSPVDGSFGTGTFSVQGTVSGPVAAGFVVNGATVAVGAGGAFNAGTLTPTTIGKSAPVTAELTTVNGTKLAKTVVRQIGTGTAMGMPALPAAGLRVNGLSLDPLEAPVEQLLGSFDFSTIISAIPAIPLINQTSPFPPGFVIFSATAQPTTFTYDPFVDLEFTPGLNCGVNTSLTFTNVVIAVNVTGAIFNAPYTSVITISATSMVVAGDLVFVQGANGLETQVQNATTSFVGLTTTVTGALAGVAQLGAIQTLIQTALTAVLSGALQLLPPLINPLLTQFNQQTFDLSGSGVPLSVGFPLASFCYDAAGVTIGLGLTLAPQAVNVPETPVLAAYRSTPGALPVFGANTPLLNVPYTAATALNDDALNVLFAAFTQLGTLNLDVGGTLGATVLNAGAMAAALPGAGFESFDPAAAVTVSVRHTTAPSVELAQGVGTQGGFYLSGVVVRFLVEATPGVLVPVFGASLSAGADVTFSYDVNTQAFTVAATNVVSTVAPGCNFPGANAGASLAALNALIQPLVGQIAAGLSGLPIPAAGGGLAEISVTGDNVVLYF